MFIHCQTNEHITPAASYTLDFILDALGHFHSWENGKNSAVTICYQPGIETENKNIMVLPQVYSLSDIHLADLSWHDFEIDGQKIPVLGLSEKADQHHIPFDILASIYFHLARIEELGYSHPDDVDKNVTSHLLDKYEQFKIPVVDILLNWFDNILVSLLKESKRFYLQKCAYPKNEDFAVSITHDVDFISAIHPLKQSIYKIKKLIGRKSKDEVNKISSQNKKAWGFGQLLPFYKEKKWTASFNFIARYTEGRHFRYSLKNKKLRDVFRRLKESGHEIGLHPSRFAFENPDRYKKEIDKLRKVTKVSVEGMRHHYLRTLFPRIWKIADKIGVRHDSTMAYRRHSGFRSGTSLPFNGFDHKTQKRFNCIEFTTCFFEESLPGKGKNFESALSTITFLKDQVAKYRGLFTVLFHTNNIYSSEIFNKIWKAFIELIENENIFLATLSNHLKWFNFRNGINVKKNIQKNEVVELTFFKPKGNDCFALKIPDNFELQSTGDRFEQVDGVLFINDTPEETDILINFKYKDSSVPAK